MKAHKPQEPMKYATPVKVIDLAVDMDPYPHLEDSQGVLIARDYIDEGRCQYVINAVNSHAALLEALEYSLPILETASKELSYSEPLKKCFVVISAAIAKAKAEQS